MKMKSILFHTGATDYQIEAVRRSLMTVGAANVTTMSSGGRTIMLVDDPTGVIDIDEYLNAPGVETTLQADEKNRHVALAESSGIYDSGIEGLTIIAGPCGIETEEQVTTIFSRMATEGLRYVRAGAYKPRTSPHDYQGPGPDGLEMATEIARDYGLQIVSEVIDPRDVEFASRHIAMIQIGTRSMQNFALLKEAGRRGLPVLLKRGMSATIEEWIGAAEHVLAAGAETVIFCERGIRTFETSTRNTLDLLGAVALKERTKLRVIADPSHAAGRRSLVVPGALGAIAAGLDGLLLEVHHDPASARSDAAQALPLEEFSYLMQTIKNLREALRLSVV